MSKKRDSAKNYKNNAVGKGDHGCHAKTPYVRMGYSHLTHYQLTNLNAVARLLKGSGLCIKIIKCDLRSKR